MRWKREQMRLMARQVAGCRWSEESSREIIHVNFLSLYQRTVLRNLVTQEPRVMLSTDIRKMKPAVSAMETWFNKDIRRMRLADSLQIVTQSALYGIGIMKVGIADPATAALRGWALDAGQPYALPVDYGNWVWDVHAFHPEECSFMGHRFRVPLEAVKGDRHYSKYRKDLVASDDPRFNVEGDERINVLGRGYYGADEEIEDMIDLWEIYVPAHNCIITLPEDAMTGVTAPAHGGRPSALCEQNWVGDESGPYEILSMENVLGNLEGKGPMQDLLDMHLPLNAITRKLFRQALRQKSNTIVRKGSDGDIKRIAESDDGDIIPLDNPQDVTRIEQGGANALALQFLTQMKELFSWFAGNLDVMGGLSPQGQTATQEKLLNQNSSGGIIDMQLKTQVMVTGVIRKLLYLHWHHPTNVMKTRYEPEGLPDMGIERQVHPWPASGQRDLVRDGNWEDIDLKIDAYSLTHTTPQAEAQALTEFITKIYMPMAQIAQQKGVDLDFAVFAEKYGRYMNIPDLGEVLKIGEPMPPEQEAGGGGEAGPQPAPETTTHLRQNMPGRTTQGDAINRMNTLAGMNTGGNQSTKNGQPAR